MKYCPITYEPITQAENYSLRGLRMLSPQLKNLAAFNLTAKEQRFEAVARAGKMSVQGVQPKLSAQLKIKEERFEIVDQFGHYILKTQSEFYPELPENEAVSMSMASIIGIDVPIHGLLYTKEKHMTYFIKRFDRSGHTNKFAVEDFAQLSSSTRETKYDSSMEKIAKIIINFCTFPKIEAVKLLKLTVFNFLIGNEDMHLKNFSLITLDKKTMLTPAYDLLNTTIAQKNTREEIALPLNGKKSNLTKRDLLDYYAIQHLQLNKNVINAVIQEIEEAIPEWHTLISHSFLSKPMQKKYRELLDNRWQKLQ